MAHMYEELSVTRFREYLRIDTSHPKPNYVEAAQFYEAYAQELGLDFNSVVLDQERSVDILTWMGTNPTLKSISLYCHTDVVPFSPEHWIYPPFSAHKDENGNIYARGAQDMKCVGIQYLEAIRKLKAQNKKFKRTIHVIFGPDEEIGSSLGMNVFVKTPGFKNLNIGFHMDEGIANPGEHFRLFYAERNAWWVEVTCQGQPGHASQFLTNTAGEKMHKVISKFLVFREQEGKRLKTDSSLTPGDVTTVNWSFLQGGVSQHYNVVPDKMVTGFDVRIPPTFDYDEFEAMLKKWFKEAGSDVSYKIVHKTTNTDITSTDDSNPWWRAFKGACDQVGIELKKEIFPAGTDARFIRKAGVPAFGFSPMNNTPILLHDHNEYLNEQVFVRGIDIYCHIIPALANMDNETN